MTEHGANLKQQLLLPTRCLHNLVGSYAVCVTIIHRRQTLNRRFHPQYSMFMLLKSKASSKPKKIDKGGGIANLDILVDLVAQSSPADTKEAKKESYIGRILGGSPMYETTLKKRADTDDTEPCYLETQCDSPLSALRSHRELSPKSGNCPSRQLQILSSWDEEDIMIYYARSPSPSTNHGARQFTFPDSNEEEDPVLPPRTRTRTRTSMSQYGSDKAAARKELYLSRVPDSISEKGTFDSATCGSI
jgi:hypothetical protein